jgi:dihydroorotate dehydrogenase (NAD+) catalytic subunit
VLAELVRTARRATSLPLWIKLSPNVTDIAEMARVCEGEGADAVCAINTLQALDVDVETRRPTLWNGLGGLSGPAIRPVALRMVWQCARAVSIPVCGIGGISSASDAVAFLLCGASAVQVGTANYLNPRAALDVVEGLEAYCVRHGVGRVADLIGTLEWPRG